MTAPPPEREHWHGQSADDALRQLSSTAVGLGTEVTRQAADMIAG